jgi:predicted membrane protein
MSAPAQTMLSRVLIILFLFVMTMATGPGVLLVNKADQWWGVPVVYLWGILWYFVMVIIALISYFRLWKCSDSEHSGDQK